MNVTATRSYFTSCVESAVCSYMRITIKSNCTLALVSLDQVSSGVAETMIVTLSSTITPPQLSSALASFFMVVNQAFSATFKETYQISSISGYEPNGSPSRSSSNGSQAIIIACTVIGAMLSLLVVALIVICQKTNKGTDQTKITPIFDDSIPPFFSSPLYQADLSPLKRHQALDNQNHNPTYPQDQAGLSPLPSPYMGALDSTPTRTRVTIPPASFGFLNSTDLQPPSSPGPTDSAAGVD